LQILVLLNSTGIEKNQILIAITIAHKYTPLSMPMSVLTLSLPRSSLEMSFLFACNSVDDVDSTEPQIEREDSDDPTIGISDPQTRPWIADVVVKASEVFTDVERASISTPAMLRMLKEHFIVGE
jgi:hypothetical protein